MVAYRAVKRLVFTLVIGIPGPLVVEAGEVIEYDGTSVSLGPGRKCAVPGAAGAIAAGLLRRVYA